MRRPLMSLLAGATIAMSWLGAPANASLPQGSCPAAFEGPLTPEEIVQAYPPPPGLPDPIPSLLGEDRNRDGYLCVREHADGLRIIVIDDRIPV